MTILSILYNCSPQLSLQNPVAIYFNCSEIKHVLIKQAYFNTFQKLIPNTGHYHELR